MKLLSVFQILGLAWFLAITSMAQAGTPDLAPIFSAKLGSGETFESHLRQIQALKTQNGKSLQSWDRDATQMRTSLQHTDVNSIPVWNVKTSLQDVFNLVRDYRFLNDAYHRGFLRRESWLYPDDGCHVRAEIMAQLLMNSKYPAPAKVFIFGNLVARTDNHPNGYVHWWFHVADAYRVGREVLVLDPAIDIYHPLPMREWITRTGAPGNLSISVCSAGTYKPTDPCQSAPAASGRTAFSEQQVFLAQEWNRMIELGRDASRVLGNEPPWLE